MFVPCTALLYDSTAETRTLKFSATLLSISYGISLISFLMMSCLVCGFSSQTSSENSQAGWDLGNRTASGYHFDAKWVCTWEVMPEVFKCSVQEMMHHLISRTENLNTSGTTSHGTNSFRVKPITPGHPIPKISTCLTIFWGGTWKTEFVKTIHRQERTSSEKKSDGFHKKCSIELWTILMF